MMGDWTFFSNHGHVFFCLARNGDARLRDVAAEVGITERAVQKIVKDLQQAGYIEVRKQGRCNRYRINRRKSLRHPLEAHCSVSKIVNLVAPGARAAAVTTVPAVDDPVPAAPATVRARVTVSPRPDIPDPEGEAIRDALRRLGFAEVAAVRAGRSFEIALSGVEGAEMADLVAAMCDKLLADGVAEIEIVPASRPRPKAVG